jgi:signal transduction histidine kinase
VVRNLLDNALQHTPPGGVIVVEAGPRDGQVAVRVSDSGPGVAAADLERIFDRFYRGERSRHREGAGASHAGLGLAIARGLMTAHRGRIWAEASPLGGVCIELRLPTHQPLQPA